MFHIWDEKNKKRIKGKELDNYFINHFGKVIYTDESNNYIEIQARVIKVDEYLPEEINPEVFAFVKKEEGTFTKYETTYLNNNNEWVNSVQKIDELKEFDLNELQKFIYEKNLEEKIVVDINDNLFGNIKRYKPVYVWKGKIHYPDFEQLKNTIRMYGNISEINYIYLDLFNQFHIIHDEEELKKKQAVIAAYSKIDLGSIYMQYDEKFKLNYMELFVEILKGAVNAWYDGNWMKNVFTSMDFLSESSNGEKGLNKMMYKSLADYKEVLDSFTIKDE